ncbi:zf-TFIIB domain-containing protein [Streptomyces sp. NPDC051322]|uniref:TFIIB-type zinc ribbon-containing protein n=1 Tax=Streptomyces sp. NPDC051322 TaxID=3154645 RepID=UPI00344B4D4F
MQCPKCHAPMHTYNRNGVQIEQCSGCRGIFLDYGELESLTRLESQWGQQVPPAPPAPQAYPAAPQAPVWGAPQQHGGGHYGGHGGHHGHHNRGFGHMLFSS